MTHALMTEEERGRWRRDGYVHIPAAISPDAIEAALVGLQELRQLFEVNRQQEKYYQDIYDAGNPDDLSIARLLNWTDAADDLLDHPGFFGHVLGLMGPYVNVLGCEAFYRFPSDEPRAHFHTDEGPALQGVRLGTDSVVVQLKVQIFLTDCTSENMGNFTVVPGTQVRPLARGVVPFDELREAKQLLTRAGDAVIFPLSLWHGVAPNVHGGQRVSLITRYGQSFCRPVDYWSAPPDDTLKRLTPRRRRLLGGLGKFGSPRDYYASLPGHIEMMYGEDFSSSPDAQKYLQSEASFNQVPESF